MTLKDLVPIIQIAIGPVILISGVALLLLAITNQFARIANRSRLLSLAQRSAHGTELQLVVAQIGILSTRAVLLRRSIMFAAVSLLFAAVLVITLFLAALLRWEVGVVVVILFICCLAHLIGAIFEFIRDMNLSLAALRLELETKHEENS